MGFEPARAATIRVDPDSRYATREQRNAYFDEVLRRVKEIPGVEARASPMRCRSAATAPGAPGPKASPTNAAGARRRSSASSATAIRRRWGFRCAPAATSPTSDTPIERAGHHDQRDDGARVVARARIRSASTSSTRARRNGASSASWATSAISRSSRRPATRCTCRCGSAAISPRPTWWFARRLPPAQLAVAVRADAAAAGRQPARQRFPDPAAAGRQVGVAAAVPGAAARRVRRVRAGAGVARHLRADLLLGESAHAGDRHPHGARRVGARRAGADHQRRRCGSPRSAWRSAPPRRGRWPGAPAGCCSA